MEENTTGKGRNVKRTRKFSVCKEKKNNNGWSKKKKIGRIHTKKKLGARSMKDDEK